jgi:UDP-glucose:(glucosyl)LPS alpha-1,2-glucosyltransferase
VDPSEEAEVQDQAWLAQQHVVFATPCYGGVCTEAYLRSMMATTVTLDRMGIAHTLLTLTNESLITRARNRLVAQFLETPGTHLFFIDADLRFHPSDVLRLLTHDRPVVAAAYPAKAVREENVVGRVFADVEQVRRATTQYVVNVLFEDEEAMARNEATLKDGLIEVLDAGTGFLAIKRHVIDELIAAHPELTYYPERTYQADPKNPRPEWAIFDTMIETGRYLSEDYAFCRRWQQLGGSVWLDPTIALDHIGSHVFSGYPLAAGPAPVRSGVAATAQPRPTGMAEDGTVEGAWGGTEQTRDGLLARLPDGALDGLRLLHSRVRDDMLRPGQHHVLLMHEYPDQSDSQHLADPVSRARFDRSVFVSETQAREFRDVLGVDPERSAVLRNAIEPIAPHVKPAEGQIRLIYTSTPHRGLAILVDAFDRLSERHGDAIHLDVYSSFAIYAQPERNVPFAPLFARCDAHPGITRHDAVPNAEIRAALMGAHVLAYPSTYRETSCLAAIEAMSAGCAVVCSDLGALPETTGDFAFSYPFDPDPAVHAERFIATLDGVIASLRSPEMQARLAAQKTFADATYSWDVRIPEWVALLDEVRTGG